MKTTKLIASAALVLALWCSAHAQQNAPSPAPPPAAPPQFSEADLEKLLAPIALYPDPLIATILPASVYPLEIVQAARFVKDTNNLSKLDDQPWDENVKAVARFPELIAKMDADLSWTTDLGQAFLEQQKEAMDTIQSLRAKAQTLGTLKTTPQQVVMVTNTIVEKTIEQQLVYVTNTVVQIQPSNPQVIYIPTYNPYYVYYPPPVYYVGPPPVVTFAAGITVGLILANNCNWHHGGIYVGHHGVAVWGGSSYHGHGNVNVNVNRNVNINNTTINNVNRTSQQWQPDQSRLRTSGAPGAKASTQTAQARGWSSGGAVTRPATSTGTVAARPGPAPSASRPSPSPSPSYNRPASGSSSQRSPGASRDSAFGGISSGTGTRDSSHRGSASRGGGSGGRPLGGRGR
ncbi:MAG: DUF3300 domain-containing protein [Verrucomicrobiota bacterium]|jgi:hypothetical protein